LIFDLVVHKLEIRSIWNQIFMKLSKLWYVFVTLVALLVWMQPKHTITSECGTEIVFVGD